MMDTIIQLIPGMFGGVDKLFAIHPNDQERAIDCLNLAFYNSITLEQFTKLCTEYLRNSGCSKAHIDQEVDRLKKQTLILIIKLHLMLVGLFLMKNALTYQFSVEKEV